MQFCLAEVTSRPADDGDLDLLAHDLVRHADNSGCKYFRMAQNHLLDVAHGNVLSTPADRKCHAFDEVQVAAIVEVTTDPSHPVMAGMPEKAAVFVDGSPVFEPEADFNGTVLAKYQESGSPLLSGYLIGENYLNGKAAALDVPLGDGHVLLIGFRPEWRGQPFGTFRVLFNAALYTR